MTKNTAVNAPYVPSHDRLGEGPLYDRRTNTMAWIDIKTPAINTMQLDAHSPQDQWKTHKKITIANSSAVGFICLTKVPGVYGAALKSSFGLVDTRTAKHGEAVPAKLFKADIINDNDGVSRRFNDGIIDPRGRFFCGSMGSVAEQDRIGELWRYDPANDTLKLVDTGIGIPNGMGFSKDGKTFYMIETVVKTMWQYDYDVHTGDISNKREYLKWDAVNPDGFCQSADAHMWIAFFGAGKVEHRSDSGELLETFSFPAKNLTATAWAGKDLDQLFVTSASEYRNEPEKHFQLADTKEDKGGDLFAITLSHVKGAERYVFGGEVDI